MMWNALSQSRSSPSLRNPRAGQASAAADRAAHPRNQSLHMRDRRVRQHAMTEIEDERPCRKASRIASTARSSASPPTRSASGSRLPWTGRCALDVIARESKVHHPVEPHRIDRDSRKIALSSVPAPRGKPMIFARRNSLAHSRDDPRHRLDAPFARIRSAGNIPAQVSKICTASTPASNCRTRYSPTLRPADRSARQRLPDADRRIAAPEAGLPFRSPRSYTSLPSTALRKNRASATCGGNSCFTSPIVS